MIRACICLVFVTIVLCGGAAATAAAEPTNHDANLGPAATTGQQAHDGIPMRQHSLNLAMACGNELTFLRQYVLLKRLGKGREDDLATPVNEKEITKEWPVTQMIGKAALLHESESEFEPQATAAGGAVCSSRLGTERQVLDDWALLASNKKANTGEGAVALVNRVYAELFGRIGGLGSPACVLTRTSPTVAYLDQGAVFVRLSRPCLARQIRVVMSNPRHGPFHLDKGKVIPELAGTNGLPCLSELDDKEERYHGDWDMSVTDYTRLTYLLMGVEERRFGVDHQIDATLDVLNTRFLTLRSSPEQGATAREQFNLATSCGLLPNQYGSAVDTVQGTGVDPNLGRYGADGRDALDGTSFWEDLLRFFTVVLIALAALAAAAAIGALGAAMGVGGLGTLAVLAAGAVAVAAIITLFTASIEETENHLLMQNSARYLKNKLMMDELRKEGRKQDFNTIADLNEDLRIWLLERMQRIVEDDFVEYNAKPYARLSHFALLNLIDFSCDVHWAFVQSPQPGRADTSCDDKDKAVVTAAAAVFDLSAAKASVGSLEGRRLIPYRRLAEQNREFVEGDRRLTHLGAGADTMIAALQVWTGHMNYSPIGRAQPDSFGQLAFYSTTRYRPDPLILELAVDKSTPRKQQYRHSTREVYVRGDGWLITAGGTDEHAAQGLKFPLGIKLYNFSPTNDRGVGVPTTLMIDAASGPSNDPQYSRVRELLRFEGNRVDWGPGDNGTRYVTYSDNNCIAGTFACGLRPRSPVGFDERCETKISDRFFAIDSTTCRPIGAPFKDPGRGLYIAYYDHDGEWGFFEVAQHRDFKSIDEFIAKVSDQNSTHMNEWGSQDADDTITYVTLGGQVLEFTPEDEDFGADRRACGVVNNVDDASFNISDVPASSAGNCSPVGRRITIDLNDAEHPVRVAEDGAPLDDLFS